MLSVQHYVSENSIITGRFILDMLPIVFSLHPPGPARCFHTTPLSEQVPASDGLGSDMHRELCVFFSTHSISGVALPYIVWGSGQTETESELNVYEPTPDIDNSRKLLKLMLPLEQIVSLPESPLISASTHNHHDDLASTK